MASELCCPRCATVSPEKAIVCRYCGYALGRLKPTEREAARLAVSTELSCPRCAIVSPEIAIVCRYCGYPFGRLKPTEREAARLAVSNGARDFDGWKWRVEHRPLTGGGLAGCLLVLSTLVVGVSAGVAIGYAILKALQAMGYSGLVTISSR